MYGVHRISTASIEPGQRFFRALIYFSQIYIKLYNHRNRFFPFRRFKYFLIDVFKSVWILEFFETIAWLNLPFYNYLLVFEKVDQQTQSIQYSGIYETFRSSVTSTIVVPSVDPCQNYQYQKRIKQKPLISPNQKPRSRLLKCKDNKYKHDNLFRKYHVTPGRPTGDTSKSVNLDISADNVVGKVYNICHQHKLLNCTCILMQAKKSSFRNKNINRDNWYLYWFCDRWIWLLDNLRIILVHTTDDPFYFDRSNLWIL